MDLCLSLLPVEKLLKSSFALIVILFEVLLKLGAFLPVVSFDAAHAKLPANLLDRFDDNAHNHDEHEATKHANHEVAELKVGLHAYDVERKEGVAREQCQHLVDYVHSAFTVPSERHNYVGKKAGDQSSGHDLSHLVGEDGCLEDHQVAEKRAPRQEVDRLIEHLFPVPDIQAVIK